MLYFIRGVWNGQILAMKRIPALHEVGARIIDEKTGALLPLSPQEQKKFEYYENLRVELAVIMYGRVRDHLGYNHQIFEKVSLIHFDC